MIDITGLREDKRPQSSRIVHALLDRLEATEKERDNANAAAVGIALEAEKLEEDRDALRAKIEQMEKQEPIAKVRVHQTGGNAGIAWSVAPLNDFDSLPLMRDGDRLYALPGAQTQPAQSTPDGWKLVLGGWLSVPEKHPTFDPVDLQLSDGSVLCGCLPQADGDYWWGGLSGGVFIDPRYAPVTHWRLAAAPEDKR